jgi:hypothetical protein
MQIFFESKRAHWVATAYIDGEDGKTWLECTYGCNKWFHLDCSGLVSGIPDEDWYCSECI